MLDLILGAAKGKAPGEDGITAEVLGAGGRPMAQLLQPVFAAVCLQRALPIAWKKGVPWQPFRVERTRTRGVMLNDQVGKISGRWIRVKILRIEPLLVARSQAIGSARRGAVMTQFTTRVFFDVARFVVSRPQRFFCDLAAAYYSVVRQNVVGSDLPEQRLLVLMDILGLNLVQRSELVTFLRAEGTLLKIAGVSPALQQLVRDMNEDTWFGQGHGHV